MKLITLNTWGGRIKEPLRAFLEHNKQIDIFCFQEVYHEAHGKDLIWNKETNLNLLADIKFIFDDYESFFHPHIEDWWGLASFIKKEISIHDVGESFVHKYKNYNLKDEYQGKSAKNIQYFNITLNSKEVTIINFHGLWNEQGKGDSEDRLKQSQNIIEFLKKVTGEIVLCGDFNLSPDTESLKMLEDFGLRNLVKEFGITSTRTSFYTKENKFADYVLVSPGVNVKAFTVLPEEVSDHAPLYLEFEI